MDGVEVGEGGLEGEWLLALRYRCRERLMSALAMVGLRIDKHRSAHSGSYDIVPSRHLEATVLQNGQ